MLQLLWKAMNEVKASVSDMRNDLPDLIANGVAAGYAAAGQCEAKVGSYTVALKSELGAGAHCTGSMHPDHIIGITAAHCLVVKRVQPYNYVFRKGDITASAFTATPSVDKVTVLSWIFSRSTDFAVFLALESGFVDANVAIMQLRELIQDFELQAHVKQSSSLLAVTSHEHPKDESTIAETAIKVNGMVPLGQRCVGKVLRPTSKAPSSGVRLALPESMLLSGNGYDPLSATSKCDGFSGQLWAAGVPFVGGNSGAVFYGSILLNGSCALSPHSTVSGSDVTTGAGVASVFPASYADQLRRLADLTEQTLQHCSDKTRIPFESMPLWDIDDPNWKAPVVSCNA
jgi:hypothetical protein